MNGNSVLDEETWDSFDTIVHSHCDDFHRGSRSYWIANRLGIMTVRVRSHKALTESSYMAFFIVLHLWACPGHPYL